MYPLIKTIEKIISRCSFECRMMMIIVLGSCNHCFSQHWRILNCICICFAVSILLSIASLSFRCFSMFIFICLARQPTPSGFSFCSFVFQFSALRVVVTLYIYICSLYTSSLCRVFFPFLSFALSRVN